ncbi:MAG: PepSY-associated TM helix domain-containing protein [Marinospirillum sp.]|uniref:PepSY-associated TM helix domain-containing protein n=1 Tax=Marinospirillum sp. TaxID=2183934 RepID=UPI0019E9584F|nr:PepSY-associated TM helix domain-containing protein [Marinospirillum sp.]MBE0507189.1 PepSY-associated TM helix domain-containing protein [Marinospirillum sp.]
MKRYNLSKSQRWVRPLHAYSSMLMLFIMLFFTVTGLTLNNRQWLSNPAPPIEAELQLPTNFHLLFEQQQPQQLAQPIWQWLKSHQQLPDGELSSDWSESEQLLTLDIKRPGGYTLVEILPDDQSLWYEHQYLGWMAVINDLHMGRYSGQLWSWFIDIAAVVMLVFTLTGFWLVLFHPKRRSRTLTLSGFGTLLMVGLYFWMLF